MNPGAAAEELLGLHPRRGASMYVDVLYSCVFFDIEGAYAESLPPPAFWIRLCGQTLEQSLAKPSYWASLAVVEILRGTLGGGSGAGSGRWKRGGRRRRPLEGLSAPPGASWWQSGTVLEPSWVVSGPSSAILAVLDGIVCCLGGHAGPAWPSWRPSWPSFEPIMGHQRRHGGCFSAVRLAFLVA